MFLQLFENFLNVTDNVFQQVKVESFHVDCDIELSKVVQMLDKQLEFWYTMEMERSGVAKSVER